MPVFDRYTTGRINPESGVYLCTGCNETIPLSKEERFLPCVDCGSATWMMVAVAGEAGRTYGTGRGSPESGLSLCTKCKNLTILISKGDHFPPCARCKAGTEWQVVVSA